MLFHNKQQLINNGETHELQQKRKDMLTLLESVIDAVDPYNAVNRYVQQNSLVISDKTYHLSEFKDIYLIAFGKASVGMAQAVCDQMSIKTGAVITNDPQASVNHPQIKTFHGGHPIPNEESVRGARYIKKIASNCGTDDLLLVLISGGGSALLSDPQISLKEMQKTTQLLLHSGATISEINTIRKHLSNVKGGRLIEDTSSQVLSLIISDVVNDPVEFIASGPTAADSTTYKDAQTIFKKYQLWESIPFTVRQLILDGIQGKTPETPKPENPLFQHVHNELIATNKLACSQAVNTAKKLGYLPKIITTSLIGEARDMAKWFIETIIAYNTSHDLFIAGGETTVTIQGNGNGGRNQEFILGSLQQLSKTNGVLASFATDGIDGASDAAGAIADKFSFERGRQKQLIPEQYLKRNDSYHFFHQLHDLLLTGPTGTNVMDIQIMIC